MNIIEAVGIQKSYKAGTQTVSVLRGIDFSVAKNESVSIMGPSGSGKSTLLHILGLMSTPDTGQIMLNGESITKLSDNKISKIRRRSLGFIFQKFNLISTLNVIENVFWPLMIDGGSLKDSTQKAKHLLKEVGLTNRSTHYPSQLSGGEQQRVAIARALIAQPKLVFADEPTGALDSKNTQQVIELLKKLVLNHGGSLVIVTHDPSIAAHCQKHFSIKDGIQCQD